MIKKYDLNYCEIGIVILFSLYPLLMINGYTGVLDTKYIIFGLTAMFLCFASIILDYIKHVETFGKINLTCFKGKWKRWNIVDRLFFLFFISVIISWLLSEHKWAAMTGCYDKYMGLFYYLIICGLYYAVSRHYRYKKRDIHIFFIASFLLILAAGFQFMGADPFGLLSIISEDKILNYLSFLGNTGVFSSFLCIVLPIALYMFCMNTEKLDMVVSGVVVVAGFLGIFCANTDSGYLGMTVMFSIMAILATRKKEALVKLFFAVAIFFMDAKIFGILLHLFDKSARPVSHITYFLAYDNRTLYLVVAFVIIAMAFHFLKNSTKFLCVLKWLFISISAIAFFCVVFSFLWFSIFDRSTNLGNLDSYIRFSDSWGTERGYVWRWLGTVFYKFPIIDKVFGAGEGTVVILILDNFKTEMLDGLGYIFDNAHNEYLHYLVTIGISGLLLYIGIIATSVYQCFKKVNIFTIYPALGIAILTFCAQAFVNLLQPITSPYVFIFIAMIAANPHLTNKGTIT